MSKKILYGAIGAVLLVFLIVINGAASAKVETVQPIATFEKRRYHHGNGNWKGEYKTGCSLYSDGRYDNK